MSAAFNTIVQSVITTNPFGCVAYMSGSDSHAPVEKSKEAYVAKIVYQDTDAKTVGNESRQVQHASPGSMPVSRQSSRNAALTTAHGGTPEPGRRTRDVLGDPEVPRPERGALHVTFSRDRCTLTSYSDDAIRTKVETWADSVPALA